MKPPISEYLTNGMKYAFYKTNEKIFNLQLTVGAGSIHENDIGYAHFLEHMVSYFPSKKYPIAIENQREMDKRGIVIDAWTEYDACGYSLSGKVEFLDFVLDLIINNLEHPTWSFNIFNQEKQAVLRELQEYIEDSWYPLESLFNKIVFNGTNLSLSVKYELDSVSKLNENNFKSFYEKYYIPGRMILSYIGPEDIKSRLYKYPYFNKKGPHYYTIVPKVHRLKYGTYFAKTDTKDYKIYIVFPIDATFFNPIRKVLENIELILTGGLSNRLYYRLRAQLGAVYYVHTYIEMDIYEKSLSYFKIETITNKNNVRKVLESIIKELDTFKNPTAVEMQQIKNKMDYEILKGTTNDPEMSLGTYDKYIRANKKVSDDSPINEYRERRNISVNNIVNVSRDIFDTDKMYVIYGGPEKIEGL